MTRELSAVAILTIVAAELLLYYASRSSQRFRGALARLRLSAEPGALLLDIGRMVKPRVIRGPLRYALLVASSCSMAYSAYLFYSVVLNYVAELVSSLARGEAIPQSPLVPVLPGITLGLEVLPPLLVSIGIGLAVHEFAHLAAAVVNGIPVETWGVGIFLVFPLAYVKVKEEAFTEASLRVKASILGAGVLANLAVGMISLLLLGLLAQPLVTFLDGPHLLVVDVDVGMPAGRSGLAHPAILVEINGTRITSLGVLRSVLNRSLDRRALFVVRVIPIEAGICGYYKSSSRLHEYLVVRDVDDVKKYGFRIGIVVAENAYVFSSDTPDYLLYSDCQLRLLYIVGISLALVNSAPLLVTDGGKLLTEILRRLGLGKVDKVAQWTTVAVTVLTVSMGLWKFLVR